MLNSDEENYKEAIEASFKVTASQGISKLLIGSCFFTSNYGTKIL